MLDYKMNASAYSGSMREGVQDLRKLDADCTPRNDFKYQLQGHHMLLPDRMV